MSPQASPLPPATGTITMHSLFHSTKCHGIHGLIFAFHLHTISLSSGHRRLTLAPPQIRIFPLPSFGCISAPHPAFFIARNNTSFPTDFRNTIPFQSLLNDIPLNNTPSLADDADNDCLKAVESADAGAAIWRGASDDSTETTTRVRGKPASTTMTTTWELQRWTTFASRRRHGVGVLGDGNHAAWQHAMVVFIIAVDAANGMQGRRRRRQHPRGVVASVGPGPGAVDGTGVVANRGFHPAELDADADDPSSSHAEMDADDNDANIEPGCGIPADSDAAATIFHADATVYVDACATGCFCHGHEHPAALSPETSAADGAGVANANLAASAASERQTGVSEMNE